MVRSDAARSLDEVFARQSDLFRRSRDWEPLFPAITTSPLYFRKPQTESRGMLLAGDSASFIDPFAGDGISLAMHSGSLAAQSLQQFLAGKASLAHAQGEYCKSYVKRFAPVFRNAARVRMALSAPTLIRSMLLSLAATPPISGIIVRGTRVRFPNPGTVPY
jgi:flavin-dependent dehydrogenase